MGSNPYQMAIEAIDECVREYKVTFEIRRVAHNKSVGPLHGQWRIKVMGKHFCDKDFVKAAHKAVSLVFNAHKTTTNDYPTTAGMAER